MRAFVFKITLMNMYYYCYHYYIHPQIYIDGFSGTKFKLFIQLCNSHELFTVNGCIFEWMCLCKPVWCMCCGVSVWFCLPACILLPHYRAVKSCMFAVRCHTGLQQLAVCIHTHCGGCHYANAEQNNAPRARINI